MSGSAAALALALWACGGGDGARCTSSRECGAGEVCRDGRCLPEATDAGSQAQDANAARGCRLDAECDDAVACTRDMCDATSGRCLHVADHALCPEGALCSGAAGCLPGRACDADVTCDDGLFCNGEERCVAGRCASGQPVDCDDAIACTIDVCDEGSDVCAHLPLDARCDDGQWCNGTERCAPAEGCLPGTPPLCDDALDCTTQSCDEANDRCSFEVVPGQCLIDGECRAAGSTAGSDFCRSCDPERDPTAWTVSCTGAAVDDTFEDFRAGDLGQSVANLYVHASGSVQSVLRNDVDGDGFVDAIVANYYDGSTRRIDSYVFHGSASGLSPSGRRTSLPTIGALAAAAADLNADGFVDVVFANHHDNATYRTDSYVYWGSASGFSSMNRSSLPTLGAYSVAVADLDRNGWLDVVFANYYDGSTYATTSYVYLGSPSGFATGSRLALRTDGALDVCVADLDRDGFLDLVFASFYSGSSYNTSSIVYFGSSAGPDTSRTLRLPTIGARGCAVGDVDRDGDLDVLFGNHYNGSTGFVSSRIYLGSAGGPSSTDFVDIPTAWAGRPSLADLDGNGWLDLVIPNAYNGSTYRTNSRVFFTSTGGSTVRTEFYPTIGAYDVAALDWDGDGHLDLLWPSYYDGSSYRLDSQYFPGSPTGPRAAMPTGFATLGAVGTVPTDAGHTYGRGWVEEFVSRPLDVGESADPTWLEVQARVPAGTMLRLQLRSADDPAGLATARWLGPDGTSATYYGTGPTRLPAAHRGHRYVQYRAMFSMPNAAASPILERVAIHHL